MKNYIVLVFLMFFINSNSFSQGEKGGQILFTHDNDMFAPYNKDENYTGGFKLEILTPDWKIKWLPFYNFKGDSIINIQRVGFGGTGYTPYDLANYNIIPNDRPYASLVFFNIGKSSVNFKKKLHLTTDLLFGKMGLNGPGRLQSHIHSNHWFGSERPVPNGWDNQIGYKNDNSSFIINYNTTISGQFYQYKNKKDSSSIIWFYPLWTGKADLGNYMINFQVGAKLNLFNINSNYLQDYLVNLPTIRKTISKPRWFSFNIFVEPAVRLAAYNSTLEGLMFNDNSVYKIPHSSVNRLLFEINSGINLTLFDVIYVKYTWNGRSQEFFGGKNFHTWGSVTLGFSPQRWYSSNKY